MHDTCYLINILHSISALVEAESPVRHQCTLANNLGILLCGLHGRGTSHKVKVEYAAEDVVFQELLLCIIDFDVHACTAISALGIIDDSDSCTIRIQQENSMSSVSTAMVKVYWVIPVQVCTGRDLVSVTIPEGACVVCCVQHERIRVLP